MELPVVGAAARRVEFSVDEVTGAVGDSVTVLPVVVAASALTDLRLPVLLVRFGAFQVVWGLRYGAPISDALAAAGAQLAMTVGNAAVATRCCWTTSTTSTPRRTTWR